LLLSRYFLILLFSWPYRLLGFFADIIDITFAFTPLLLLISPLRHFLQLFTFHFRPPPDVFADAFYASACRRHDTLALPMTPILAAISRAFRCR
jgi:hypothetical protein